MSIIKYAVIGAAIAYGINHVTKKRETDGKSILDDLNDQAPEWMDKIKSFADDALGQVTQKTEQAREGL